MQRFQPLWRAVWAEHGNVAIVTALALPLLVGFTGLGAETGYWYYEQRRLQAAADLAAYAGAVVARAGAAESEIETASQTEAGLHGFDPASGVIAVNAPPLTGANMNARSVEVRLQQRFARIFSALFLPDDVVMSVRAVASYEEPGPACILSLHPTQAEALLFSGSASARFSGCDLMSNSLAGDAVSIKGAVEVTASCVNAAGGIDNAATLILDGCPEPRMHMPVAEDPYKDVPPPADPGCSSPTPVAPGKKFCGGLTLSGTVTLDPGVYIVSGGDLRINGNSSVSGQGVTFHLTDGAQLHMNGTAHVDLSAPTTGPYQGILVYADPQSPDSTAISTGRRIPAWSARSISRGSTSPCAAISRPAAAARASSVIRSRFAAIPISRSTARARASAIRRCRGSCGWSNDEG